MMPILATGDDAASERACQALATNILDFTRLATASMYRNKTSLVTRAPHATQSATTWTCGIAPGRSSLLIADHSMPPPTSSNNMPSARDAAVS
ncbi:hypothetical protein D3C86_1762600 [compost metagenome]